MISILQDTLAKYSDFQTRCSRDCDAMVLGSLIKALLENSLLLPPKPPYHRLSVSRLAYQLQRLKIPSLCSTFRHQYLIENGATMYDILEHRIRPAEPCEDFYHKIYMTAKTWLGQLGGLIVHDDGGVEIHRSQRPIQDDWDFEASEEDTNMSWE